MKQTPKFESASWLLSQFQLATELLIIDCRPLCDYTRAHLEGAINISVPTLMLRRLRKGNVPLRNFIHSDSGKQKYDERSRFEKVVVYDERSTVCSENSLLEFLQTKLAEDASVVLLKGGFVHFEKSFPHLCQCGDGSALGNVMFGLSNLNLTGDVPVSKDDANNNREVLNAKDLLFKPGFSGPIQIVPHLYLGNRNDSCNLELLRAKDITHVLNVTHDLPNIFANTGEFEYLQLPVQDNWNGNVMMLFPKAYAFIENALEKNGNVLVHCLGGISRSSTIIIAYLMLKYSFSLNAAYEHVKNKKRNIAPNFNFMGQLLDFERAQPDSASPAGSDVSTSSIGSDASTLSYAEANVSC